MKEEETIDLFFLTSENKVSFFLMRKSDYD